MRVRKTPSSPPDVPLTAGRTIDFGTRSVTATRTQRRTVSLRSIFPSHPLSIPRFLRANGYQASDSRRSISSSFDCCAMSSWSFLSPLSPSSGGRFLGEPWIDAVSGGCSQSGLAVSREKPGRPLVNLYDIRWLRSLIPPVDGRR